MILHSQPGVYNASERASTEIPIWRTANEQSFGQVIYEKDVWKSSFGTGICRSFGVNPEILKLHQKPEPFSPSLPTSLFAKS